MDANFFNPRPFFRRFCQVKGGVLLNKNRKKRGEFIYKLQSFMVKSGQKKY
jgi:hypothetical protein